MSWRKGHSYLTLVSNNDTGTFVWGKEGKDTATLDCFFDELGEERSQAIEAMSMDMGAAFEKSARKPGHATKAVICYDPFHVVQARHPGPREGPSPGLAGSAEAPRPRCCPPVQGCPLVLLKNPGDLNDDQSATLRKLKRTRRRPVAGLHA